MIRLVILALALFIIWLIFASNFSLQRKKIIVVAVVVLSAFGLWFEQRGETPKQGRISPDDIQPCGVTANHSYRSNFDIDFCLHNTSTVLTVKRIELKFLAQRCTEGQCSELQAVNKEVPLILAPSSKVSSRENLQFDLLDPTDHSIVWTVQPITVKAVN